MRVYRLALAVVLSSGIALGAPEGSIVEETGGGFKLSSTDHILFSNSKDPDDPSAKATSLFAHENKLLGEYRGLGVGITFTNRFTPDGPKDINSPFVLEKKTGTAEFGSWKIQVGDSYQELGRGIALSLYRDPVFGLDTTVEGVSAKYAPKGTEIGLFGGRINALKVPVAINPVTNPILNREVLVAGGSVKQAIVNDVKLGGQYLLTMNRRIDSTSFDKRWHTAGATLDVANLFDEVDVYAETNVLLTQLLDSGTSLTNGYGTYGSVVWSPLPWKVKLEVKDYRNYFYDFRRPPTLEDDVVVTLNTQNVSAGRLVVEHRFEESKSSLFASYLGGWDREANTAIHHAIAGTKIKGPAHSDWELKAGVRGMPRNSSLTHVGFKTKWPTGKGESIEAEFRKQFKRTNLASTPVDEDRNQAFLTYTWSEALTTALGYEYVPTSPDTSGKHFVNVGGTAKWGQLTARLFAGQTSGGTLCSGGVCRQVPAYTGAYVETTYVF